MRGICFFLLALAAVLLLFVAVPCQAHKARVFAYAEDGKIFAESGFSGGRSAKNCEIQVFDAESGDMILTGRSDEKGEWSFPIPQGLKGGVKLVLTAGEGHRGEWLVTADELAAAGASSASGPTSEPAAPAAQEPVAQPSSEPVASPVAAAANGEGLTEAAVERAVERALAKKLGPIKKTLLEISEDKPELKDIVGGIGYLVGAAGLIAYLRSRRTSA